MINIYSIKEVIEASNNILNRTKSKNKVNSVKKLKSKTKNKDETNIMLRMINFGESVGRRAIYSVDKRSILYLSIISNA